MIHDWNQVDFDPRPESILMPHQNKLDKLDPDSKTKSFSTPTQNQVNSDPYTEINPDKFDPPQWNQLNFDHQHSSIPHIEINSISTTSTKPSAIRSLLQK